jgi:hypothetical protein
MKFSNRILAMALVAFGFVLGGCDKTKPYDVTIPPPEAHFVGAKTQAVSADPDPVPVYNVIVGTTDVAGADRTVTYKVTSPSGATGGVQYSIANGNNGGTVTILANEARANIPVQINHNEYTVFRKDTLVFYLESPSLKPSGFLDTVRLIITGGATACDESAPNLADLLGDYANTNELLGTSPYGPYTTSISSAVATGPTTGTIVVENIWDNGWGPITFNLDWTDPANRTVTVVQQNAIPGSDAGDLSATYAGQTVAVRPYAASGPGTYSACDEVLVLNMQLGVTGVGWFGVLYKVTMER